MSLSGRLPISTFSFSETSSDLTAGRFSFTVGCKTEEGFTVILVERSEGVETKLVKTSYSPTAGSAFVTFDNVKVPVENTLGQEGGGIFVILRCRGQHTPCRR